ncbi:MAG: aldo/keto reductase [Acutalibacteraceae bacterium]
MEKLRLGKTELMVTKTSFGALPIQRDDFPTAIRILRKAFDAGINYFDTARYYTDSEEKLGAALSDVRKEVIISSKSMGKTKQEVIDHCMQGLRNIRSDYFDLYQLHNPSSLDYEDPDGPLAGLLELQKKGYVRHIGITNHSPKMAIEAIESGVFETLQFPFCYLSGEVEDDLLRRCKEKDMGFIAMKALSGGLVGNVPAAVAFIRQYDNVVPIFGIQHEWELDEFLALDANPPALNDELWAVIEKDRKELAGEFCRSCGYCMPCPQGINIPTAARIHLLATRAPYQPFLTKKYREEQKLVENCVHCGKCASRCPYHLDTPSMLAAQNKKFWAWAEEHKDEWTD